MIYPKRCSKGDQNIVYVLIIIYTVNIYFDKSKFNYCHREEGTGVWVYKRVCTYNISGNE